MNAIARYRSNQVRQASNVEIVQMLFAEAVSRLEKAAALPPGKADRIRHLHHVREIYLELQGALDPEAAPDFVALVGPLYSWVITQLIRAGVGEGADVALAHALHVTSNLAEGWYQVGKSEERSAS
ncbi:MAG: flagellar protein FliS [Alphaproteobacteria bacterium]|nr:flagellar protein FliS [Alphaproteobacteria bacterium]MCB9690976.1 flagellar protein FliS [Alphaproteobacteria bacterium]